MRIARIMRKLGDLSALAREIQGSDVPAVWGVLGMLEFGEGAAVA
jgi:hypothetical protein